MAAASLVGRLRLRGSGTGSKLVDDSLAGLPNRLAKLNAASNSETLQDAAAQYLEASGLSELAIGASDVVSFLEVGTGERAQAFQTVFSRLDYSSRLRRLAAISEIIGTGFDDVTPSNRTCWLTATSVLFPLSVYYAYNFLSGETPVDLPLSADKAAVANKLLPILLYAAAIEELRKIRTEKEAQDNERLTRLQEGLRTVSPSLRDLAFSKTRKDLNLTGIKNLYSRTYGEVFSTAVVTVPSNQAPTLTYGVDKRAQLLFVIEYCARNLGNGFRVLEEYDLLAGRGQPSDKPVIPNPSVFLAILRREMARVKNVEKAIVEAEKKLHNQAFIYYSEGARSLSRLPVKTRPQMNRFLKEARRRITQSHSEFNVDQIPASLREELAQFLAVSK